jgi:hypothetical protein
MELVLNVAVEGEENKVASKRDYITEARKMFHDPGVLEIPTDTEIEYEYETVVTKYGTFKEVKIGAFVWGKIWLHADDAEPE